MATTSKNTTPAKDTGWTQFPPKPKVPNFHTGHGHTLMYANPGCDVYPGTFTAKGDKPDMEPLFHARLAAEAKAFAEAQPKGGTKPAARKPSTRKTTTKTTPAKTDSDQGEGGPGNGEPAPDTADREAQAAKMRAANTAREARRNGK